MKRNEPTRTGWSNTKNLPAAEVILVRVVYEPIVVGVVKVLRQGRDATNLHAEIRVVGRRRLGIEDYRCVGVARTVRYREYVHPDTCVLFAENRARRETGKVDYETRGALRPSGRYTGWGPGSASRVAAVIGGKTRSRLGKEKPRDGRCG